MAKLTRTWWGQRFIAALEKFTDPGRLGRGRSYARNGRILSHSLSKGKVTAKVEGNINPYFGVYETPIYNTTVQLGQIAEAQWQRIIQRFGSKASFVSQLLMNAMPDAIEETVADLGLHLLPHDRKDFQTRCSCPDSYNPCKHIAGVCYLLAARLDKDPLLLFELRGLSRQQLKQELLNTPLGNALAKMLETQELPPQPVESYYTRPQPGIVPAVGYQPFWTGEKRLPETLEPVSAPGLPAILIRKAGDYPAFWQQDRSFVEVMSEIYEYLRKQNKALFHV